MINHKLAKDKRSSICGKVVFNIFEEFLKHNWEEVNCENCINRR